MKDKKEGDQRKRKGKETESREYMKCIMYMNMYDREREKG